MAHVFGKIRQSEEIQGINPFISIVNNSQSISLSGDGPNGSHIDESHAVFKRSYFPRDGISITLDSKRI